MICSLGCVNSLSNLSMKMSILFFIGAIVTFFLKSLFVILFTMVLASGVFVLSKLCVITASDVISLSSSSFTVSCTYVSIFLTRVCKLVSNWFLKS